MVRLYRRRNAGWEYWECWPEEDGLLVHRGRAGERGIAERVPASALGADERLAALVERERRRGFREPDPHGLGLVLVHWPGESAELLPPGEAWMRDALGWTGLGAYVGFDDTVGLTIMGETVDPELAVDVLWAELGPSGLPATAVIAVSAEEDVIHWPPARRGERLDAP